MSVVCDKTAYHHAYMRRLRHTLIEQFGGKCANTLCQSDHQLEFAHRDHSQGDVHGRGRGSVRRLTDVKKNSHLYVLLCKTCHLIYDTLSEQTSDHQFTRETHEQLQVIESLRELDNQWPSEYFKI